MFLILYFMAVTSVLFLISGLMGDLDVGIRYALAVWWIPVVLVITLVFLMVLFLIVSVASVVSKDVRTTMASKFNEE